MEATDTLIFQEEQAYYEYATTGQRFANFLIDIVIFYAFYLGLMFLIGVMAELMFGAAAELGEFLESGWGSVILNLGYLVLFVLFFALIERLSKGRSLGKLITRTVAVREDGGAITWKNAFGRSLCRLIPFETFSGFGGHPWHDSMTKTIVVKK